MTLKIKFSQPITPKTRPRYSRLAKFHCDHCVLFHRDRASIATFTLRLQITLRFPSCISAAFVLADRSLFLRLQLPRYSPRFLSSSPLFFAFLRVSPLIFIGPFWDSGTLSYYPYAPRHFPPHVIASLRLSECWCYLLERGLVSQREKILLVLLNSIYVTVVGIG
jgi:hypothetical protein